MYKNQAQNNIQEKPYISLQKLGENKFVRGVTTLGGIFAGIIGAYKIAKTINQSHLGEVDAAEISKNLTNIVQYETLTQEEINKQTGIIEDPNFVPPEDKIAKGLYFVGDNLTLWKKISGYKQLDDSHGKFWFPYSKKEQTIVKAGKNGKLNPELSSEDARNLAKILYDYWVSPENKAKSDFQTKTDLGKTLRDTYGIETKGTKYDIPAVYKTKSTLTLCIFGSEYLTTLILEGQCDDGICKLKPVDIYTEYIRPCDTISTTSDDGTTLKKDAK